MRDAVFYNYNGFDAVAESKTSPEELTQIRAFLLGRQ